MLNHLVLFKLKEYAENSLKEVNVSLIKSKLNELPSFIPQIMHYQVERDIKLDPSAFDIILISKFHCLDDLQLYKNHPKHIDTLNFIMERVEKAVVIDFFD